MNEKMKQAFKKMDEAKWNEWIQRCEITDEQLRKLKTKHNNYAIKPSGSIKGSYIWMKYRITFYQDKKEVDSVELLGYCIDTQKNEMLGGILANWNILMQIITKLDEYRGDGNKSKRPDYNDFLLMYEKLIDQADGKGAA